LTGQREARFVREGDWLMVRVSGAFSVEWFVGVVASIATAQRSAPATAVLIDMRGAFGTLSDLDRYRIGMAAVHQDLKGPVAVVGQEPILDPRRFAEVVARNRGVNVRGFTDEPEARAWLREQTGAAR
jgi:hypothetical protein